MKNSLHKVYYLKLARKYCPTSKRQYLEHYLPEIRAQAVIKNGELVHDFLFEDTNQSLLLCSAPSPAATPAIPIREFICDSVEKKVF